MGCTEGEATMERLVPISLVALLLAFVTTLPNKDDWDIYSFHINSTVASRYATTVITSRVANRMEQSKEIEFHVRIPKNAFISKFRMFIDGQVYDGAVKAKEQAQQQYDRAVSRGQSAGLVSSVGRTMEEFKTSVTVAAHRKVTFELTYEELLKRRLGKYELQIHARPMQPVKDFKVDVHVHEKAGINFIEVKGGLSTNALGDAITKTQTDKEAWVHFYPTEDQQKTCDSCGEQGLNGDLVLVYDVNRDNEFGDIKNSGGYFVHHFAPSKLARIPKNVVFVIDQSGSMHGKKIQQTRTALIHILTDLAEDDFFGLITFSGTIFYWKRELIQATKANVNSAKGFAQNIPASGGTNINEAVIQGTKMLNEFPREGSASILILLTDGDPTTGVTNPEQIQSNVRQAIADRFPLYCLGFGFDVNFEFLEKMSLENNGAARRIYEDSDADLQLKGFYEEVATPLLTNVTLTYAGGTNLTQTHFRQYYNGSEIVVAGEITDNNIGTFTPEVVAISVSGRMKFLETNDTVEPPGSDSRVQRVWAYLTVKQLLEKELLVSGAEKDKLKKEALDLSLKYSFVTPLTSMVVTKPQGEGPDVLHKPTEGAKPTVPQSFGTVQHYPRGGAGHASRLLKTSHDSHILQSGVSYGHYAVGAFPEAGAVQHSPGGYLPPPLSAYDDSHHYHDFIFPTGSIVRMDPPIVSVTKSTAPVSHRFLHKSSTQPLPLCFDVPGDTRLKLLHHPNRELSVNGILDSGANRGFKKIGIHIQKDQFIEMYPSGIVVKKAQDVVYKSARDLATAEITVIGRDNEFEVTSGDIRMIVLIHLKDGEKFLWPVLQQKPSNVSLEGILALQPAVYDEVQQTPSVKLQIKDQVIDVTRSTAVDYSVSVPPTVECWLVSPESALQGPLDDFTVAEL